MKAFGAGVFLALLAAVWVVSGLHSQQSVGVERATVQAQMTAVAGPTPTATP